MIQLPPPPHHMINKEILSFSLTSVEGEGNTFIDELEDISPKASLYQESYLHSWKIVENCGSNRSGSLIFIIK